MTLSEKEILMNEVEPEKIGFKPYEDAFDLCIGQTVRKNQSDVLLPLAMALAMRNELDRKDAEIERLKKQINK